MRLRSIPAVFAVLLFAAGPAAAETPYRVSMIGDSYSADSWLTGVRVELDAGWKTYWRMPGEAGIPPEFSWRPSVPAEITVLYPLPGRFADPGGETVGYKHEVVFPVTVKTTAQQGVRLDLDLFFAVCREVCIPANAKASIDLGLALRDPAGSRSVEQWQAEVPAPGTPVTAASVVFDEGKPVLALAMAQPADDIFVEMEGGAYFHQPVFSDDGRQARLVIENVKNPAKLKGAALKLTVSHDGRGLEQQITLP
jgi:suppressor for copper-sensitivity B